MSKTLNRDESASRPNNAAAWRILIVTTSITKIVYVFPLSLHPPMSTRMSWFGYRGYYTGKIFHDITVTAFGRRYFLKVHIINTKIFIIVVITNDRWNTPGGQGPHVYSILSALLIRKMLTLWSKWKVLKTLPFIVASCFVFELSTKRTIFPAKYSVMQQRH